MEQLPTYEDVQRAARRLAGIARRTPVVASRTFDAMTGTTTFFKCENFQNTGAFKFRGAYNAIAALPEDSRRSGVITYSSGNHAQAIALAGRMLDVRTVVLMPHDAPASKMEATLAYGACVVSYHRYREDRELMCKQLIAEHGYAFVHPFDHDDIIAGQGTCAAELFEEVGELDVLFVCLGGGGLLAGSALAAKALCAGCRVVGVEPETANDGQQSFIAGRIVRIPVPQSIADGAVAQQIGQRNFSIIRATVSDVVVASDGMLTRTMRFFAERMKMIVEPTGCLSAAAVLHAIYPCKGLRVGVIVSGGNVDLATFNTLLA